MGAWVFLLILLACPLMMMFMMRGMGGGHKGHQHGAATPAETVRPTSGEPVGGDQARIAQLEHEVAQLRELRGAETGDDPRGRR